MKPQAVVGKMHMRRQIFFHRFMAPELVRDVGEISLLCANLLRNINGFAQREMRHVVLMAECIQHECLAAAQLVFFFWRNEVGVGDVAERADAKASTSS